MSLTFNVSATDGNFQKKFDTIEQAEAHFGKSYASEDISNDGVTRAVPADKETEAVVEEYRLAAHLNRVQGLFNSELLGDKLDDAMRHGLAYRLLYENGKGLFALREQDKVDFALKMLTAPSEGEQPPMIKEDVLISYDKGQHLLVIEDHRQEAKSLSELISRPFCQSAQLNMEAHLRNEDEGGSREIKIGYLSGQVHTMLPELKRIEGVVEQSEVINASVSGYKNHQENPEMIYASEDNPMAFNNPWISNTLLSNKGTGEIDHVAVVDEEMLEKLGAVPGEPGWVCFYEFDKENNYELLQTTPKQLNIGDIIDVKGKSIQPKNEVTQQYEKPTEDAKQEYRRQMPF